MRAPFKKTNCDNTYRFLYCINSSLRRTKFVIFQDIFFVNVNLSNNRCILAFVSDTNRWQQALEFAATVPKPKVKKVEVEKLPTPEKNHHQLSELQILEAKHEADRQHVEVTHFLLVGWFKLLSFCTMWRTTGYGSINNDGCLHFMYMTVMFRLHCHHHQTLQCIKCV